MKVAVITPTIGTDYLTKCVSSVEKQTYENLTHHVFVDGKQIGRIGDKYDSDGHYDHTIASGSTNVFAG